MWVLYVDGTDIYVFDACIQLKYDLWAKTQCSKSDWGKLLILNGGTLKPEKCFYYLVDYKWLADGSWQYLKMVDDFPALTVPLSDGRDAPIEQLPVNASKKTLNI